MTRHNSTSTGLEELRAFGMKLQMGLEQMADFERELYRFSKSTLILFIVLNLEEDQFQRAQAILDKLELLSDAPSIAGF